MCCGSITCLQSYVLAFQRSPVDQESQVGLIVVGSHLSDVAGLEADVERPLDELLARRFSSASRPANCTAHMNTVIKMLVHNALMQTTAQLHRSLRACRYAQ